MEPPEAERRAPSAPSKVTSQSSEPIDTTVGAPAQAGGLVLRPYQLELVGRFRDATVAGHRRVLMVLPTGAGKTVVVARIIAEAVAACSRVLFLAHRRELIAQASQRLHAAGVDHGIILADHPSRPGEPVQVASIPTLHARAIRARSMEMPPAELVIVDEAHHCRAATYRRITESYPDAIILGVTATPCRGDGRGLGGSYDVLLEGPSVAELTSDGYLVPARVYAPSQPDLTGVRTARGDYVEAELAARMNTGQLVGDIVSTWLRLGDRRPTVVFAAGVPHSVHLRDEFRRAGVMAEHLDGSTPAAERDAILRSLAGGSIEVVVNAMVLTEGWDSPTVSCLVLARPTRQIGLYRQMVGRVLRPAPGKTEALILDHAGAIYAHGFPDEPIAWTLAPDRRAENAAHAARTAHRAPALTTCPECSAVRMQGAPCPVCGWRPRPKPRAVDIVDGDLGEVDRQRRIQQHAHSEDERHRFHRQLAAIAEERGYKAGWAAHKYREKFGQWPRARWVQPLPPDDATRAWVRSRQIAYAKSLGDRGAA